MIWDDRNSTRNVWASTPARQHSTHSTRQFKASGGDRSTLLTWGASSDVMASRAVASRHHCGGPYNEITPRLVTSTFIGMLNWMQRPISTKLSQSMAQPTVDHFQRSPCKRRSKPTRQRTIAYENSKEIRLRDFANFSVERVLARATVTLFGRQSALLL